MKIWKRLLVEVLLCSLVLFSAACSLGETYELWDCPNCGRKGITRNYCGNCGYPAPWIENASLKLSRDEFSKVGSIVRFGHFEQDNNLGNGSEEIEWIVLDAQAGKSLLISKYGLEANPFNTTNTDVTWETCTLRSKLNNDFLKAAFTKEEQSAILTTKVDNSESQGYSGYNRNGGKNTQDQIFLLSYNEAFDLYFKNDDVRRCVPTQYAVAHGADKNSFFQIDGQNTGLWWLRSPYDFRGYATGVNGGGTFTKRSVNNDSGCVRPAFWINLESELF